MTATPMTGRGLLGAGAACSVLADEFRGGHRCDYLIVQTGTEDGSPPKAGPR